MQHEGFSTFNSLCLDVQPYNPFMLHDFSGLKNATPFCFLLVVRLMSVARHLGQTRYGPGRLTHKNKIKIFQVKFQKKRNRGKSLYCEMI